jgi:hypothetical protein
MATMITRDRAAQIRYARLIAHERVAAIPARQVATDRLVGELVSAFFVAMAVMWFVTAITGIFG